MKKSKFPPGWNEIRVRKLLQHYESQSESQAVAEDEATYENRTVTFMGVPKDLVPKVRGLIAQRERRKKVS